MDQVGKIMAFEQGNLDDDGVIELFQELIVGNFNYGSI